MRSSTYELPQDNDVHSRSSLILCEAVAKLALTKT